MTVSIIYRYNRKFDSFTDMNMHRSVVLKFTFYIAINKLHMWLWDNIVSKFKIYLFLYFK